jgi:hypothetical protein
MHGSSFNADATQALRDLAAVAGTIPPSARLYVTSTNPS